MDIIISLIISIFIIVIMFRNVILCKYTEKATDRALSHLLYIDGYSQAVEDFIYTHQSAIQFLKKRFQITKWRYNDFYGSFERQMEAEKEIVDNQRGQT